MKWLFYVVVFIYMFYRAVYGAKGVPKSSPSLSIDRINYGTAGYISAGTRKNVICKTSQKNQTMVWIDSWGNKISSNRKDRVYTQEMVLAKPMRSLTKSLVLTFNHTIVEDSGLWTCRSGDLEQTVSVCIINPSKFVNMTTEVTIDEGRSITLTCQARGDPEPEIFWYRNDNLIDDGNSIKYKVMTMFNTQGYEGLLTVMDVESEDAGEYTCVAVQVNIKADDCSTTNNITVNLHVNYAPIFDNGNTTVVYGIQNESLDLLCDANGYPTPSFQWFHVKGEQLFTEYSSDDIKLSENGLKNRLTLDINKSVFGETFQCKASNFLGFSTRDFFVLELIPPVKPSEVTVHNAAENFIQLKASWLDLRQFPVDGITIQYINVEMLVRRKKIVLPREADWKNGHEIEVKPDENNEDDPDFGSLFVTIPHLEEETDYWIRMRLKNDIGQSMWSDAVVVSTTAKENVEVTSESNTEVTEDDNEDFSTTTEKPVAGGTDAMFYGIFFAGGIFVVAISAMVAIRWV